MRSKKQCRKKSTTRKNVKRNQRFLSAGQGQGHDKKNTRVVNPLTARVPPTVDQELQELEEGKNKHPYIPIEKLKFVSGNPLLKKYMKKTTHEENMQKLADEIYQKENQRLAYLAAKNAYLHKNGEFVNRPGESFGPSKVVTQPQKISIGSVDGINLFGEKPEDDDDYGFFVPFGGKKRTKKRRCKR